MNASYICIALGMGITGLCSCLNPEWAPQSLLVCGSGWIILAAAYILRDK